MKSLLCALLLVTGVQGPAGVRERFDGSWTLTKYENFGPNGEVRPATYDTGMITYDANGFMAAHLMRSDRAKEAPTTEATRAAAHQSYLSYYGPFTVDAEKRTVTHHVRGSTQPHWAGTDLLRYYEFSADGKQLMLSLKVNGRVTGTLTWTRVGTR